MSTETQPWLRAELIAAPETTPGAQLMIPADGIEFHDDQLVFHNQGDIVYVASQGQLRSITWLAKQPNPATARRRAQWPNHGTRWTDEEREDLLRRLQAGQAWKTISTAHGRSRSGCQQEAVKQGWLDAETLQLKPEFLPDARRTASTPAAAADEASATASPNLATGDAGDAGDAGPYAPPSAESSPAARGLARHATGGTLSKDSSQPGTSHAAGAAPASTAEPPAGPQPQPTPDFATAAPPPTTPARTTAASPSAPHSTDSRSGQPSAEAFSSSAALHPDPRSRQASSEAFSSSLAPDPSTGSATPHPDPRSGQPSAEVFSGSLAPDPSTGSATPHPDSRSSQASAEAFSSSLTPDPSPGSATPHPDPRSSQASSEAFSSSLTPDPSAGSATPHPDPLLGPPARSAIPFTEPSAPDAFSSPLASETAAPNPDRPRFPPRVPRQRINPDNLPGPAPERDSGPDSEPGPRPGSRFFSRAQSSLARATLGAYMTPPRGESGAAPGAT